MSGPRASKTPQLFQRDISYPAAAVLFLIENSETVGLRWPNLRDRYLKSIVAYFQEMNKNVPIKVITLESAPLGGQVPQEHTGLDEGLYNIQFNSRSASRISLDTMNKAIDLLGSFKFEGEPVASHIVVVAASTPVSSTSAPSEPFPWYIVSKKIAQLKIHFHLALAIEDEDLTLFTRVFEAAMLLGDHVLVPPPFQHEDLGYFFSFCAKAIEKETSHPSEDSNRSPTSLPTLHGLELAQFEGPVSSQSPKPHVTNLRQIIGNQSENEVFSYPTQLWDHNFPWSQIPQYDEYHNPSSSRASPESNPKSPGWTPGSVSEKQTLFESGGSVQHQRSPPNYSSSQGYASGPIFYDEPAVHSEESFSPGTSFRYSDSPVQDSPIFNAQPSQSGRYPTSGMSSLEQGFEVEQSNIDPPRQTFSPPQQIVLEERMREGAPLTITRKRASRGSKPST